jgi:GT2 family glycosyltransferase
VISIIVLAHNHLQLTRQCLDSLAQSRLKVKWEVLCVDNGSSESLRPLLDEFGGRIPGLRILRNSENLSYSRANNRAVRDAAGQVLIFLNNDVIVQSDTLALMFDAMESDEFMGVAGGKLLFPESYLVQHGGIAQMLWGFASNFGVGASADAAVVANKREMMAVTGALLCIRRSLFESIGGFGEEYIWGYEDLDICMKVRRTGKKVMYVPQVTAVHAESSTLKESRLESEFESNYRLFRSAWDHWLVPREMRYLSWLRSEGVERVVIYGTGRAARGLFRILTQNDIAVVAFTSDKTEGASEVLNDLPVVPLEKLDRMGINRLMVGSQFFFRFETAIARYDPLGKPIFPVMWWLG